MFSQLNDDEFVAQNERKFLSRKKTGYLLLIISLAMIGAAGYFAYDMGNKTLRIADNLSYIGAHSSDEALRENAKKTSAKFALLMGVTVGFILCGIFSAGIHVLMQALYLLFDSRKERLLIEYSKRLRGIR
jgi:hypothetical protein